MSTKLRLVAICVATSIPFASARADVVFVPCVSAAPAMPTNSAPVAGTPAAAPVSAPLEPVAATMAAAASSAIPDALTLGQVSKPAAQVFRPASANTTPIRVSNIADLQTLAATDKAVANLVGSFKSALGRPQYPAQQVDVEEAVKQAEKNTGAITFSPEEQVRQRKSGVCDRALRSLAKEFESMRDSIGYPPRNVAGLADFADWYYGGSATAEQKRLAEPIVESQRDYMKACMTVDIPREMNPTFVKQAVGILSVDQKPFCSALRISKDQIETVKHCFLQPSTGALWPDIEKVVNGTARLTFAYEAEPDRLFEVCRASLPPAESAPIPANKEPVRVSIAATTGSVAPLKRATLDPKGGTSLYLRGLFPFATGPTILDHIRGTAEGGCAALAVRGRCVFHGCQALSGMSGGPIFVRPDGPNVAHELQVAGLHVGPAGVATGSVCPIDGSVLRRANFGYLP